MRIKKNKKVSSKKDKNKLVTANVKEKNDNIENIPSSCQNIIKNSEKVQKTLERMNTEELHINDYVMVNYNDEALPGKIIGIRVNKENEEFEYEVSHMEKNGLNWKWPKEMTFLGIM